MSFTAAFLGRTRSPDISHFPWQLLLFGVVVFLAAQPARANESAAEALVLDRLRSLQEQLATVDAVPDPDRFLSRFKSEAEGVNLPIPRTPSGRPPKLRFMSIKVRPEEVAEENLAQIIATAAPWFDWSSIRDIVSAGLHHHADILPPTDAELQDYVLRQHSPFLNLALHFRSGNEHFRVLRSHEHPNGDVTIAGSLRNKTKHLATLRFRLRPHGSTYRILDVRVGDFSLLDDLRSWHFRRWLDVPERPERH